MKDILIYNAMRLGVFLATFSLVLSIWAVSNGGSVATSQLMWVLIISFVVSGIASYFLLRRQREKFAVKVENVASRAARRVGRSEDSDKL